MEKRNYGETTEKIQNEGLKVVLFEEREKLSKEFKNLEEEYENRIEGLKNKYLWKLHELRVAIDVIRSKLFDLGVSVEDC